MYCVMDHDEFGIPAIIGLICIVCVHNYILGVLGIDRLGIMPRKYTLIIYLMNVLFVNIMM